MGATCVVTAVTGHEEYVEHGWNGLVVDWDDPRGTARPLDLLASDPRALHFLRMNALATARAWPSGSRRAVHGAGAAAHPPRPAAARHRGRAGLIADLRAGTKELQRPLSERRALGQAMAKVEGILGMPGLSQLVAARRRTPVRQLITVGMRTLLLIAAARGLPARARTAVGSARARARGVPGRARAKASGARRPRVASTAPVLAVPGELPQPGVEGVRAHVPDGGARNRHTIVRPPAAVEHGEEYPGVARRLACRFVDVDAGDAERICEAVG